MKKIASTIIALIIMLSFCCCADKYEKADDPWPTKGLAEKLPVATEGRFSVKQKDSYLEICIFNTFPTEDIAYHVFSDYVQKCKESGFTIDSVDDSYYFRAYNELGDKLVIQNQDFISLTDGISLVEYIKVCLYESIINKTYNWPKKGLASLLPVPDSTAGEISNDSSDTFSVYVCKTTTDDYSKYVDRCLDAGFDRNYSRVKEEFTANNADGFYICVSYEGFDTMHITIREPEPEIDETK